MGFRASIVTRVLLIMISGYSAIYLYLETSFWLLSLWIILITVLTTVSLIKYLERNRRDMTSFLTSIQQNDFTTTFPNKGDDLRTNWHYAFNVINAKFQELRSDKQSNYHFLEAIIEHTGVPLMCFNTATDKVTLMNDAAKDLLKKPFIDSIGGLTKIDKNLSKLILKMQSGQKELYTLNVDGEALPLSIIVKELKLENQSLKLVAFQNIKHELEENELASWQKLIKVLTHEIKNSAIPISTLSSVISQMIMDDQGVLKDISQLEQDDADDLKNGLTTVEKRSKGLVKFVESYSKLSRLPEPELKSIKVGELLTSIENLMKDELSQKGIGFQSSCDSNLTISADQEMIEQVLINLVKNAIHACENVASPSINLIAHNLGPGMIISIADNGMGIGPEELRDIFVPFFTTKKEGSGIGLSLSRQIMKLHAGSISVKSEEGKGSAFYLRF